MKPTEPFHRQVFIGRGARVKTEDEFERRLYILRKVDLARASISVATATSPSDYLRRVAVVPHRRLQGHVPRRPARHVLPRPARRAISRPRSRSCTSASRPTPSRPGAGASLPDGRAQRRDQHAARQRQLDGGAPGVGRSPSSSATTSPKLWPISYEGQSDTACFDNALEFLVRGGYSLPHAAMMLIPEAWAGNPLMDEERRAFYEYHAALMEPWDGPAAIAFTDGRQIGATLDRNGLRPARYLVTSDDRIVMASEMGVLPIPEEHIVTKWRLQPGKMLLIDLVQGRHHLRRRDQGRTRQRAIPIRSGSTAPRSCSRSCPTCRRTRRSRTDVRCSIASRRSATPRKT